MSSKFTPLPSQLDLVAHIAKLFGNRPTEMRHMAAMDAAAKNILSEFTKDAIVLVPKTGIEGWLARRDVGVSSRYLAHTLGGLGPVPFSFPCDVSDFGRCVHLFKTVPALRMKMHMLADLPAPWPQMLKAWTDLETLYTEAERSKNWAVLHNRIRALRRDVIVPMSAG